MRSGALKAALCGVILCSFCISAYADESLRQRQNSARADREALQSQIKGLQQKIDADQAKRDDVAQSLRSAEEKISHITKTLHEYDLRRADLESSLQKLKESEQEQKKLLDQQRKALAKQLKAQYASGLSSWTSILSGKDPQDISRDLSYLSYVLHSRVETVDSVKSRLTKLSGLSDEIAASNKELVDLQQQAEKERSDLKLEQQKRNEELDKVKASLADKESR